MWICDALKCEIVCKKECREKMHLRKGTTTFRQKRGTFLDTKLT